MNGRPTSCRDPKYPMFFLPSSPETATPWPEMRGFLGSWAVKEYSCQCRSCGFHLWVGKIPWRGKWQPTPVFMPGKSQKQRSLVGSSPWGRKESDNWPTNTHTWYLVQNRYLSVAATGLILSLIMDVTLGPSPAAGILFRQLWLLVHTHHEPIDLSHSVKWVSYQGYHSPWCLQAVI